MKKESMNKKLILKYTFFYLLLSAAIVLTSLLFYYSIDYAQTIENYKLQYTQNAKTLAENYQTISPQEYIEAASSGSLWPICKITDNYGDVLYMSSNYPAVTENIISAGNSDQIEYIDNTVFELHHGTRSIYIFFPEQRRFPIYITFIMIMVCIATGLGIILRLYYKPIDAIRQKLFSIVKGADIKATSSKKTKPILSLIDEINMLLSETKDLLFHESNTQLLVKEAELNALQSQINPHFLYNTLEAIRGQAIENNMTDIEVMTRSLSKMFRYSINNPRAYVALREELAIVDNYLSIQHMRFGDKFKKVTNIDEDCLDLIIPKLTIQPLVENAIFHGLETKEKDGIIEITAYSTERTLRISVKDNGSGISEKKLVEINQLLSENRADGKNRQSIGIYNVHSRITLSYGTDYGLHVSSLPNAETTVSLILPKIFDEQ